MASRRFNADTNIGHGFAFFWPVLVPSAFGSGAG